MSKEVLIGVIPAVLIFLSFLGLNVAPFIIIGLMIGVLLYFVWKQNGMGMVKKNQEAQVVSGTGITFEQIGGQERAKREVKEALDFLLHKQAIQKYGIRPLKGILLTGPPGTGKTLLAKAAASYTNSAFVAASGSEFVEMYVGVGAQRVRDLFKKVKQLAEKNEQDSGIIFIDEIDVLGGKRDGHQHREYDQTLNQLLTEMDGISTSDSPQVLVMAATNRADMLDPALTRPGRFDRQITVDLPDKKARQQILKIHVKNKPVSDQVDLEAISRETFGFSGAQLESLVNEAAIYAMRDQSAHIEPQHFSQAIDKVMMGEASDRHPTKEEKKRVAIHELGHGIISELLRPGSVSQVALRPRGQALGYVRHHPGEEQYLYTREFLEEQIMVCLGGAAAEEIFYQSRSTGSKNDFEQALSLVHNLIDSGLSELGIVHMEFVSKQKMEEEINNILDRLFERTKRMLEGQTSTFEKCLHILFAEEVLNGEQFRELLSLKHAREA